MNEATMGEALYPSLGRALARIRDEADLKQADIAETLGVHPSAVSRIETGATPLDLETLDAYLDAINSQSAKDLRRIIARDWVQVGLPQPQIGHPNLGSLIGAADDLRRLDDFLSDASVPKPLEGQARLLREEIVKAATFLASGEHSIAYIGDIGVGKTTALCFQSGLVNQIKPVRDLKDDVLLATGGGRTTVCEVRVKQGDKIGILIDPTPDAEVYRLVAEFALDLWERRHGRALTGDESRALTSELDFAIRNMASIRRRKEKDDLGQIVFRDEAMELAREADSVEDLRSAIAARLQLYKRTTRELAPDSSDITQGKIWLKDTFSKINGGKHALVSLPQTITITMPFRLVDSAPLPIEVIDTKGVEQGIVRADIKAVISDPRCVPVLCCGFKDAPGASTNDLIEHLKGFGFLRAVEEKAILLVLDQKEHAKAMRDEATGDYVESVEDGRAVKKMQIEDALGRRGVRQLPVYFFNALEDEPRRLNEIIWSRVQSMRQRYENRLVSLSHTIDTMIQNREHEYALAAQRAVNHRIEIFVNQNSQLRDTIRRCQEALLDQLSRTHPRTLWASMRRAGSWPNFDVYLWLGVGAEQDAHLRSLPSVKALMGLIDNMLGDEGLQPTHRFLDALKPSIEGWNEEFLASVRNIATEVFRPSLDADSGFWEACENEWGQGGGYRQRVRERVRDWFEEPDRQRIHNTLNKRIKKEWKASFVRPLQDAVNAGLTRNDELASN
jgi:transcriptional regulator with XRE-family HTH domain